jgi:hypothetical protein
MHSVGSPWRAPLHSLVEERSQPHQRLRPHEWNEFGECWTRGGIVVLPHVPSMRALLEDWEETLLGGAASLSRRGNTEETTLVFVQKATENRGRVELGPWELSDCCRHTGRWYTGMRQAQSGALLDVPAHEINAPVHSHQGTCVHIPNDSIVLDGQVAVLAGMDVPGRTGLGHLARALGYE